MSTETMHDRPLKAGHFGKFAVHVQFKQITGKPEEQGLIRCGCGFGCKVRLAVRKFDFFFRCIFAAEAAVQARKNRGNTGKQPGAVGVPGFKFGDDQSTLIFAFIIIVGNGAFGREGAFRGNGIVEDNFMLAVQNAGQIDIAGCRQFRYQIVERGDREAGDNF